MNLEGVAVARRSACRQRRDDVSAIVKAAYPEETWRARGATRWSLGWTTTQADVDEGRPHRGVRAVVGMSFVNQLAHHASVC
jgi:cysteine sulfinate desulfinase/cysteine desulfurase-like protein